MMYELSLSEQRLKKRSSGTVSVRGLVGNKILSTTAEKSGGQMGISKTWGKDPGENAQKNLSVPQKQGRSSSVSMFFYSNVYIDAFKADMEISKT